MDGFVLLVVCGSSRAFSGEERKRGAWERGGGCRRESNVEMHERVIRIAKGA